MDLPCLGAKSPRKNPVDHPAVCEQGVRCGRCVLIPESVSEIGSLDDSGDSPARHVHIQVASKYDRRIRFVPLRILQSFFQLRFSEPIIPSTFKMQVVCNDGFASDIRVDDQRKPAAQPFLEGFDFRQKPVWPPKAGLLTWD